MQLLMDKSFEFGENKGLGLISGEVVPVPSVGNKQRIIVPYVGWSKIDFRKSLLTKNLNQKKGFYFTHSFMSVPKNNNHIIATYKHFTNKIVAVIGKNNFYGCQFHPEKSGSDGLFLIKNFINLN